MSDESNKTLKEAEEQFQSEDVSPAPSERESEEEPEQEQEETKNTMVDEDRVDVPEKDNLITMSKEQLKETIRDVTAEYDKKIQDAENRVESLKLEYEKKEKQSYMNRRGEESTSSRIQVNQTGPLNPIDHQSRLVEQHKGKLDVEDCERIEEALHPFPCEVNGDNDE